MFLSKQTTSWHAAIAHALPVEENLLGDSERTSGMEAKIWGIERENEAALRREWVIIIRRNRPANQNG